MSLTTYILFSLCFDLLAVTLFEIFLAINEIFAHLLQIHFRRQVRGVHPRRRQHLP